MKKIILFGLSVLFALTNHAQLTVDTLGRICISPQQDSGNAPTSGYAANIQALESGGLLIKRDFETNKRTNYGINIDIKTDGVFSSGVNSNVTGVNWGNFAFGTKSVCSGGRMAIGIYGGLGYIPYNGAGIFGSTTSLPSSPILFTGIYAGYFNGDVRTTGTIYGTLVSPSSVSSPSCGGTTTNLSEQSATRGESIMNKLQQVDLLQMERMNQNGSLPANKVEEKRMLTEEKRAELGDDVDHADDEPIQTRLSDISYGLAADQLQEVFPELVYEDAEGNYCINYVEMVPLLVQSIRELSGKVATLEAQLGISEPTKPVLKAKGKAEDANNVTLTLPDESSQATLNIYDLNGRLLRTASVDATSAGLYSHTHGLPTGTYAYSLTVNGKKQKARKVVVK